MELVTIVLGAGLMLVGAAFLASSLEQSDPGAAASRYDGFRMIALGGLFVLVGFESRMAPAHLYLAFAGLLALFAWSAIGARKLRRKHAVGPGAKSPADRR